LIEGFFAAVKGDISVKGDPIELIRQNPWQYRGYPFSNRVFRLEAGHIFEGFVNLQKDIIARLLLFVKHDPMERVGKRRFLYQHFIVNGIHPFFLQRFTDTIFARKRGGPNLPVFFGFLIIPFSLRIVD